MRSWERNPQLYAETLASSLAAQAIFDYAPEEDRARRILSKLRQTPRLIEAARENIKEPPAMFVKVGLDALRGVMTFIDSDLPKAFRGLDDLHLLSDLADASQDAVHADRRATSSTSKPRSAPRPRPRSGSVGIASNRSCATTKGISLSVDRLLAIAERELRATQEEFRTIAGRMNGGDPIENWRKKKQQTHPEPGQLLATAREQLRELQTFLQRNSIVSLPDDATVEVGATPDFFRWSFASMWTPGPFETRAAARDVLPDRRRSVVAASKSRSSICATSTSRRCGPSRSTRCSPGTTCTTSTCARSSRRFAARRCLRPASYIEGWAHYCEQMMLEAGFGKKDYTIKLGQLAESLVRLARFIVGIRLHTDDWSVEQGVRFFRDEAFLEESSARREAERGTFDPTYLVYTAGKLAMLKLRADWQAQQGGKPSLRAFHDALLSHGSAPIWALRRLMLGRDTEAVLE